MTITLSMDEAMALAKLTNAGAGGGEGREITLEAIERVLPCRRDQLDGLHAIERLCDAIAAEVGRKAVRA